MMMITWLILPAAGPEAEGGVGLPVAVDNGARPVLEQAAASTVMAAAAANVDRMAATLRERPPPKVKPL